MRTPFSAIVLAAGLALAARSAPAIAAPAPATDLVQLAQYYGPPGYYGGPPGYYPHPYWHHRYWHRWHHWRRWHHRRFYGGYWHYW